MLWSAAWSPDACLLATASRDQAVKLWWTAPLLGPGGEEREDELLPVAAAEAGAAAAAGGAGEPGVALLASLPDFPAAATAVAFAPVAGGGPGRAARYLLAVGLESGAVELWRVEADAREASQGGGPAVRAARLWAADSAARHCGAVRRLAWRGAPGSGGAAPGPGERLQLASVAEDHALRVFSVARELLA